MKLFAKVFAHFLASEQTYTLWKPRTVKRLLSKPVLYESRSWRHDGMKTRKPNSEEWASRIFALRKELGLTQAALASRLHFSAMALSRWQNGTHEPTSTAYVRLENLASKPDCFWFWERAGLSMSRVRKALAQGGVRHAKREQFAKDD